VTLQALNLRLPQYNTLRINTRNTYTAAKLKILSIINPTVEFTPLKSITLAKEKGSANFTFRTLISAQNTF
jgi:hypothetical protein